MWEKDPTFITDPEQLGLTWEQVADTLVKSFRYSRGLVEDQKEYLARKENRLVLQLSAFSVTENNVVMQALIRGYRLQLQSHVQDQDSNLLRENIANQVNHAMAGARKMVKLD